MSFTKEELEECNSFVDGILDGLNLAGHAETWWAEQGNEIPPEGSSDWDIMYAKWIAFAFNKQEEDKSG